MIEVLLPIPERDDAPRAIAPRLSCLRYATLGFLDGWGDRGADGTYRMYPVLRVISDVAKADWHISGVRWIKKARAGSPASSEQYDEMAACDAVITGTCLSGGCTNGAIGDAAELERRGVPTVTLCQDNFEDLARSLATSLGFPTLRLFVYPKPRAGNVASEALTAISARGQELMKALTVSEGV